MEIPRHTSRALLLILAASLSATPATVQGQGQSIPTHELMNHAASLESDFWEQLWLAKHGFRNAHSDVPMTAIQGPLAGTWQYGLRQDLIDSGLETVIGYEALGVQLDDPILEDYLFGLLTLVAPNGLIPGRPEELGIRVVVDPAPRASALPNGTILLSTGTLSLARTTDELLAVIAHEVAHIVLEHSLSSVVAALDEEARAKRRAERQTALAAIIGAAAGAAASVAGDGDAATALATSAVIGVASARTVRSAAISRGRKLVALANASYSRALELEADAASREWLRSTGRDPAIAGSYLSRIRDYNLVTGAPSTGPLSTHPDLVSRIYMSIGYDTTTTVSGANGRPVTTLVINGKEVVASESAPTVTPFQQARLDSLRSLADAGYDRTMASPLYRSADAAMNSRAQLRVAKSLLDRSISVGQVDADVYILRAEVERKLTPGSAGALTALQFLSKADSVSQFFRPKLAVERAAAYSRLGDRRAVVGSLTELRERLLGMDKEERQIALKRAGVTLAWIERSIERNNTSQR